MRNGRSLALSFAATLLVAQSCALAQTPVWDAPVQSTQEKPLPAVGSGNSASRATTASAGLKPQAAGTTYSGSQTKPFNPNQYLNADRIEHAGQTAGHFAAAGSSAQPQQNTQLFAAPYDKGYFYGYKPGSEENKFEIEEKYDPAKSPQWVKDKVKMRYFQDNTEHFGREDPYGFY